LVQRDQKGRIQMRDISACFCYALNGIQKKKDNDNKIQMGSTKTVEAVSIFLDAMSSFGVFPLYMKAIVSTYVDSIAF